MSVNAKQSVSGTVAPGGNVQGAVGTGTVEVYSYYTPNVTQPDENTMQVEYAPSSKNMPTMDPVVLTLPKGKDGVNGRDGIDGKDGYTPQKGVDYFDGKDGYTPQKGVDYFDGKDGYTPQKGVDYFDGKDGKDGVNGKDGYTPQKGVDYFTSDDISQVANTAADLVRDDIAAGIASAIGGSY